MTRSAKPLLFPLILALGACTAKASDSPAPPIAETDPPIERPEHVGAVSLGLSEHTLPAPLANDPTLSVAYAGAFTLVGGAGGLYELTGSGFMAIDAAAVSAMAPFDGTLVIANSGGLHIFDGSLSASPLNDALGAVTINALATRGAQLWIGTTGGLYVFESGRLTLFTDTMSVNNVWTFTDGADVVVQTTDGRFQILRLNDTAWSVQDISDEGDLAWVLPAANGRTIGLIGDALVERVNIDAQVGWLPLAVSAQADASGAEGIHLLAIDPTTGAVWAVGAALTRIEASPGRQSTLARPSGMGTVVAAVVTSDGALWTSDGSTLRRQGSAGEPVSFAGQVAGFSQTSCNGCHVPLGVAPMPLETYEEWVLFVDKSITRLEDQTMPPAGSVLSGGSADLVRRWRDDGLRP